MFKHTTFHSLTSHLLALLGYLLLSIALTWPLILHWNTGVYGGISNGFVYPGVADVSQNIWNMWWVRRALEHGQNPFWTDLLYYPDGVQMYLQTMNIADALMTLPIQYLAGPVAAYNTALMLAFILTGYAGFLLVRTCVPGMAIPFLCGTLLTASPFHMVKLQVNHLHLISMQWVVFYVLALFQLNQPQKKHGAIWAAVFFLLASFTSLYWGLVCVLYSVFWFLLSLGHIRKHRQIVYRYMVLGSIVCICFIPFLLGIFQIRERLSVNLVGQDTTWFNQTVGYSAHMLGLFFPSALQPIWGSHAQHLTAPILPGYSPDGWYVAAGWVLLLCASLGVWWSWRNHWRIFIAGTGMWLFSLGPTLYFQGKETHIDLPYALLQNLPLLSSARKPSLFAVVCIVIATMFAGIGLQRLIQNRNPQVRSMLLCGITLLAVIELWPPVQRSLIRFEQPVFLQQIQQKPGAVADLPLEFWIESGRSLQHQMIHEQPVLAGYVARWPEYDLLYMPLIHQLVHMQSRQNNDIMPLSRETLMSMQCYMSVRHVAITKSAAMNHRLTALQTFLTTLNGTPLPPSFEDETYVWYELPLFPDKCQPFLYLGTGWHTLEYDATHYWRWASDMNKIWLVNPFTESITAVVQIQAETSGGLDASRMVELWHDNHRIAHWSVRRSQRTYTVVVIVPPGRNEMQLRTPTTLDQQTGRELGIAVMKLSIRDYSINNERTVEVVDVQRGHTPPE